VSRILLLIVLVLWMARSAGQPTGRFPAPELVTTFVGGFALVVLFMGAWSRILARHVTGTNLHASMARFTRAMYVARLLIPAWFGVGLFALGWGELVEALLGRFARWPMELPGAILGTAPPILAWMGLWWAQFPADRALREQGMLVNLNEDLPVHRAPGFWSYFFTNLRLQVLFTLVPVILILLIRDVACVALWRGGAIELDPIDGTVLPQGAEVWVTLGALALVFLFVPEMLRHVLKTEPLPASALRNRLEALCRRSGLKYREILLWHTDHAMGNAAVMGMLPQVRYILLSDLLVETMTDAQIEAVFAHEIGHVVHRHMSWYAVFLTIIMAGMFAAEQQLGTRLAQGNVRELLNLITVVAGCGGFFFLFGCLSRWFERQADVYAARTMQRYESREQHNLVHASASASLSPRPEGERFFSSATEQKQRFATGRGEAATFGHVGPYGANLFASALHRVAVINNIPLEPERAPRGGLLTRVAGLLDYLVERANDWFHGSIPTRMNYLRAMSNDPRRTSDFDRSMAVLYAALLVALVVSGTFLVITIL
jgi:STE24 endopeptidase